MGKLKLWLTFAWLCMALALLAAPASAAPSDRQQFDRAVNRFETGRLEEAVVLFEELLKRPAPTDPASAQQRTDILRDARPIYAACLVGTGKVDEADAVILDHLRDDPFFQLTPGKFPAEVADRFDIVREQNASELERLRKKILEDRQTVIRDQEELKRRARKRLETIERMASEVQLVRQRSRWVAAMPFGAGQFQNDNNGLGVFFATSQTLAIAGTIATSAIGADLRQIRCAQDGFNCADLSSQYTIVQTMNWISFGSTLALMAAGIIEAQVSFEETTTTTQKRPIPPRILIEPDVGISDSAAYIGIRGSF